MVAGFYCLGSLGHIMSSEGYDVLLTFCVLLPVQQTETEKSCLVYKLPGRVTDLQGRHPVKLKGYS